MGVPELSFNLFNLKKKVIGNTKLTMQFNFDWIKIEAKSPELLYWHKKIVCYLVP